MEIQGTLTQGKWLDFNYFVQLVRHVTMISNYRTIAVAGGRGLSPLYALYRYVQPYDG